MGRTGIQLCYPFEERRLLEPKFGWKPPYLCQPKLDGERCRAVLARNQAVMVSSECNEIRSCPEILSELKKCSTALSGPLELDGELYRHGMSFEEIHSIVGRTKNLNPEHTHLHFNVFDIVDTKLPQLKRILKLQKLAENFPPHVKLVPTRIAETLDDVRRIYDEFVSLGYEGIIVRHCEALYLRRRSTFVMKFKPKKKDIWPIVGFVEGHGKYRGTIGAIKCKTDEEIFEVGSFSMSDEERSNLWKLRHRLREFDCEIGYQHRWASGKPKSGVFYRLVERIREPKFENPLGV